jgi:DNA polymerase I-like protein with 3'-5' exonuclease and polymerase domains
MVPVQRWAKVLDFNPRSGDQIKDYIRHKKYPMPKNRKTKKDTTDEEGLEWIQAKLEKAGMSRDPILDKIVLAKKYSKAEGYLYDKVLGRDGRMHPVATFVPKTGRLSYRRPNFQNIPQGHHSKVEKELALAIRSTIIPTPGHVLVELDWKAIEALLVGFFAGDQDYIRICLDPHSYLASYILVDQGVIKEPADKGWPDDKLVPFLKWIKSEFPDARSIGKKNNHAGNYDQQAENRAKDVGCTVAEAERYMRLMDEAAPLVRKWKEATRWRAHTMGRLDNPFGYPAHFFDIFKFEEGQIQFDPRTGKPKHGREAWEALAFLPQSTGAAMCREAILEVAAHEDYGKFFWLLVPIHDSLFLECLKGYEEQTISIVRGIMERKWPELDGLHVDTDVKVGYKWSEMNPWKGAA